MRKAYGLLILAMSALPWLPGCSAEMAYRSGQSAAEQACLGQPPSEVARCQERIYRGDYQTYEKNRPRD